MGICLIPETAWKISRPRKFNSSPLKRDHVQNKTFHLPTINFHGFCSFFEGGIRDFPHFPLMMGERAKLR